jgi:hypothetical protein
MLGEPICANVTNIADSLTCPRLVAIIFSKMNEHLITPQAFGYFYFYFSQPLTPLSRTQEVVSR